ncbi:radical SAM protein [Desulfovibrio aminophilus]|nr:radical SAM protein [Desulfovibrio aminophilus]MCM0756849.1 radical SAM protein [Desulfovibrio aminophilus]
MSDKSCNRSNALEKSMALRRLNQQVNAIECANNLPICLSRPLNLGLDISSACNIKCIFCLAESGRKLSSDADAFRAPEWLDHFDELLPYINMGIFSSFEALLNPGIEQFVRKMRAHCTPFQVFTNGNALTPEMSEFLLANGLQSVWCSFHGAERATYEGIMRGSDYERVLSNLMHLKLLARRINPGFRLTLVFCAMGRTIQELPRYVDLAHRVGAKEIQVNYLLVTTAAHQLDDEAVIFHRDRYDHFVLHAKLKAAKLGILLNHQPTFFDWRPTDSDGPCARPWQHMNVSKDGVVTVCCGGASGIGNLFTDGFHKVWNGKAMQAFRRRVNSGNPPAACRTCTRGRENPLDVRSHLTYLRGLNDEQVQARLEELGLGAASALAAAG